MRSDQRGGEVSWIGAAVPYDHGDAILPESFSSERIAPVAMLRRMLRQVELADRAGLTSVTISKAENGHQVEPATAERIAEALDYPLGFFFLDTPEIIEADTVSFRSLKKMSAAERDASLAAGVLGIELYQWIDHRFDLPATDLIDLNKERSRPESAARLLRQHWGLGDRPIGDVLKLLESKGVRVLPLSHPPTANEGDRKDRSNGAGYASPRIVSSTAPDARRAEKFRISVANRDAPKPVRHIMLSKEEKWCATQS